MTYIKPDTDTTAWPSITTPRKTLTIEAIAISATTWDRLELFSAETPESSSAVLVRVTVSLAGIAATSAAAIVTEVHEAGMRRHWGRSVCRLGG